jgi:hypothetical protein
MEHTRRERDRQKIKIDNITVEPIHVDHPSPPHTVSIETLRPINIHGRLRIHVPEMTLQMISPGKQECTCRHDCEGTRMTQEEKRKNYSEADVQQLS